MGSCSNLKAGGGKANEVSEAPGTEARAFLLFFPRRAPRLPLLPATHLQLEWCCAEPCIPLSRLCRILLGDPGATIELLRRVREESGATIAPWERIEECVVGVDLRSWLTAMQQAPCAAGPVALLWRHARQLAGYARMLAPLLPAIPAHMAYLAALLGAAAEAPELLGWEYPSSSTTDCSRWLTRLIALPPALAALLQDAGQPDSGWARLLAEARAELRGAHRVA